MRPSLRLALLALLVTGASLAFAATSWAATSVYTVASQADTGATTCTATPSNCTLRQAINTANADGTDSEIDFNITTGSTLHPIFPLSPLPAITAAVTIDGTTQSGSHLVEVGGSVMPQPLYANADGFVVSASNVVIKGLDIQGFARDGVQVLAGSATIIDNVIGANGRNGIYVGGGAVGGAISNNNIGRGVPSTGSPGVSGGGASGGANGNGHDGIAFDNADSSTVPTLFSVSGNVISNNVKSGVGVFNSGSGATAPGSIQLWDHNRYEANGGLAIDLDDNGVTANDPGDGDNGPNARLNYPLLGSAVSDGVHTTVGGGYDTSAGAGFTIYFYSSPTCDPSGYGEGQTQIGSVTGTADFSGHAPVSDGTLPPLAPGTFVTALAVDTAGDTSEFSNCQRVPGPPIATTDAPSGVGTDSATLNGTVNPNGAATSVHFEYGPTSSYGLSTGAQDAGTNTNDQALDQALGSLAPGQTIHYRVVATNSQGTTYGADREFTTATPPPAGQQSATQTAVGPAIIATGGGKGSATARCIVPKLSGKKLADIKKALARAHCKLGKVKKAKKHGRKKGTALGQSVRVGIQKPAGAQVNVTIAR